MDAFQTNSDLLSTDEFVALARRMESFHELFRALWEIGEPEFTEGIETAAIVFDSKGSPLRFLFNPTFWKSLPMYDRDFVVCHEMLHAVLNHGFRGIGLANQAIANVAADLAVNHLLVSRFGFMRELLQDWKSICWVDTVFTSRDIPLPAPNLTMEEYYKLCMDRADVRYLALVDQHYFGSKIGSGSLRNTRAALELEARLASLGPQFGREIANLLGAEAKVHTLRGETPLGAWCKVTPVKPQTVPWEDIIRRRLRRKPVEIEEEGWVNVPRRMANIEQLTIPGLMDGQMLRREGKQRCLFFLDASGSTIALKDRFFSLARSLPGDQFDVELCSFDTEVYMLDLKKPVIRGGGGTSFSILEQWIQTKYLQRKGIALAGPHLYPDVVIVLTDGEGDTVSPEYPDRWHWLLTNPYSHCIPRASVVYQLRKYA